MIKPAPLVSVIIPFLNPGIFLKEAIESVIAQTFDDWELMLIDDGSIASDSLLAQAYSRKFPDKIIYLEHPGHLNKGVAASRNLGIANSKGRFIAFLDADDYWLPDKLQKQLSLFQTLQKADAICEASWFWNSWKASGEADYFQTVGCPGGLYHPQALNSLLYPLGPGQPPCPSGLIVTKAAVERIGAFDETFAGVYQLYEDQAFLTKLYLHENIYVSDQANNWYRKRTDSVSSSATDTDLYRKVRRFYLDWLSNHLREQNISLSDRNLLRRFESSL